MLFETEVKKSIDYIKKHFGYKDYEPVLSMHARGHVWREPQFRALNGISIEQLRELLIGQQSVESSKGADGMYYFNQPQMKREPSKALRKQMLLQDTDALLLDLHEAMQAGDTKQIEVIKGQLQENQKELEGIV